MNFPTSQTPPPPPVNPPLPVIAADEPTGPGLSEPQRLVNVFIAPSKTFTDIRRNASWWKPWLISTIIGLIFGVVAAQKIDMVRFAQQQIDKSPSAQRRMEQATPEQREQGLAMQAKITKYSFYAIPLFFGLVGGLIIAAIFMGVFNFILGAEISFQRALAVTFYSYFPGIIKTVLLCISLLAASDPNSIDIAGNPMPTNPAFFMDPMGNRFIYTLLSYVDIFAIWYVVLLGIGFALASSNRKVSTSTGISAVFTAYGLWALGAACLKLIF
jgi:Yip1 domain